MVDRVEFPAFLDSNRKAEPEDISDFRFVNYFPKEPSLKQKVSKVNTDWQDIESGLKNRMADLVNGFLKNEEQKINIYPKKNAIDLKKLLERRMQTLKRRTDKAIVMLAKKTLSKGEENVPSDSDDN